MTLAVLPTDFWKGFATGVPLGIVLGVLLLLFILLLSIRRDEDVDL